MELLPHLVWAGVVMYSVTRLADVVALFVPEKPPVVDDSLPDVPEDLIALAMAEQETWAQEETLRAMREKYEMFRDWNRVRSAFGVGRRD